MQDESDSADSERQLTFRAFLQRLEGLKERKESFTLIIHDPMANSWIFSPVQPPQTDAHLTVEQYTRSAEEDIDLGLADMHA